MPVTREEVRTALTVVECAVLLYWAVRPFHAVGRLAPAATQAERRTMRRCRVLAPSAAVLAVALVAIDPVTRSWPVPVQLAEGCAFVAVLGTALFGWFRLETLTRAVADRSGPAGASSTGT